MSFTVRAYNPENDETWAEQLLEERLGGRRQARLGELLDVLQAPGLVAIDGSQPVGILSYQLVGDECEILALVAGPRHAGVGTALIDALRSQMKRARRIWLITTNDNVDALRFYQRRGFRLCALHPGGVDASRRTLKPSIPSTGAYGIPLRDELALELLTALSQP